MMHDKHIKTKITNSCQREQGTTQAFQAKHSADSKLAIIGSILGMASIFMPFWLSVVFLIGGIICGVFSIILTIKQAN